LGASIKQALHEIADGLPDDCTWDDVMHRIYVRCKIQAGLDDVAAGHVIDDEEVFAALEDESASR
jgi:predicted transcriptional regulator